MTLPDDLLSNTFLTRQLTELGARDRLYQWARRGVVTLVHRGCYVETRFWTALPSIDKHRAKAQLTAFMVSDDLEFSHLTAAAFWRLPILGQWPDRVHVAGHPGFTSHRTATLARHSVGFDSAAVVIDGVRVASLSLTVAQVAATEGFAAGVVVADAALRRTLNPYEGLVSSTTSADLMAAASTIALNHGGARARSVAAFADGLADRPGESMSRVCMQAAGIAPPLLQVELFGASGTRYVVDFYWPGIKHIGEFDGKWKYEDPEFLRGRTPAQALIDEKAREDDLRAAGYKFTRWGWTVAISPARLAARLRYAGVR